MNKPFFEASFCQCLILVRRATASPPLVFSVSADIETWPRAIAVRSVTGFGLMLTMLARPRSSIWVSFGKDISGISGCKWCF